mmetsp:Transcript_12467/g.35209  ORF Transcript_12467/g.35209 Transcript_12467/m.35209 type:complete len:230 (+) Transcript_12467:1190-1879(+)
MISGSSLRPWASRPYFAPSCAPSSAARAVSASSGETHHPWPKFGSMVVNGCAATLASFCSRVTQLKKVLLPALGLPTSPTVNRRTPRAWAARHTPLSLPRRMPSATRAHASAVAAWTISVSRSSVSSCQIRGPACGFSSSASESSSSPAPAGAPAPPLAAPGLLRVIKAAVSGSSSQASVVLTALKAHGMPSWPASSLAIVALRCCSAASENCKTLKACSSRTCGELLG